jgi:hypothetical protein
MRWSRVFHIITMLDALVIVSTFVLTSWAVLWGIVSGLEALVIPIGSVTFASGLYVYNWVDSYKARRGIPRPKLSEFITRWAIEAGYDIGDRMQDGWDFRLRLTRDNRQYIVGQITEEPTILVLGKGITLGDAHREAYEHLSPQEQDALMRRLLMQAATFGGDVEWIIQPRLQAIELRLLVVFDNTFDRRRLLMSIFSLRRAEIYVIEMINLELNTKQPALGAFSNVSQQESDTANSQTEVTE